jgi:formate/nitrite transporter FocA (FNT family)
MSELYGSDAYAPSEIARMFGNLLPVIAGNLIGSSVLVGLSTT